LDPKRGCKPRVPNLKIEAGVNNSQLGPKDAWEPLDHSCVCEVGA
jgi:hypothetical protein